MKNWGFWLRWSWRDLRHHWVHVSIIALIAGMGIGIYSGFSSTTPWRIDSANESYALLNMFDLHLELTTGSFAEQHALVAAIEAIPHAHWITSAQERLIVPITLQAPTAEGAILVRGKLVGLSLDDSSPINGIHIEHGRALTPQDSGQAVGILEYHFASHYDLPAETRIALAGNIPLEIVGQGLTPEYFMVSTPDGGVFSQASFAAVFTSLATAQNVSGTPGRVNDALLRLSHDAEIDLIRTEIEAALRARLPETGFTLTNREDDPVYALMFSTIRLNQEVYDVISVLFMAGAMLGAFNLANRLVESQRRQIGIGMALGVTPRWLAARPLLVGAQIATGGTALGMLIGLGTSQLAALWIDELMPMPVSGQVLQPGLFVRGAAIGVALPLLATLYPVWRAVRVTPIDAIRTGHLMAKTNGKAPIVIRRRLPGSSLLFMPIRNLLRSPRRTLLTVSGIATAITTLVAMAGMRDTALSNLGDVEHELFQEHRNRQIVHLDRPYPAEAEPIMAIAALPEVGVAEASLRLPGQAHRGAVRFDAMIEVLDFNNNAWSPTILAGQRPSPEPAARLGVLISKSAAIDLKLDLGDSFFLTHPYRTGPLSYTLRDTEVVVAGFHGNPWRFDIFLDTTQADLLGMGGLVNTMHVIPAPGVSPDTLRQAMFLQSGVASVIAVTESVEGLRRMMSEVVRFLNAIQGAVVVLAFLIAFNSTMINLGERARELATMFAFGLPVRTATGMAMIEAMLAGLGGTLLGMIAGRAVVAWFYLERMPAVNPDMQFDVTLYPGTFGLALLIGVGVVMLTPLFTMRRLTMLDIPAALRVME